jgi:hypothetical protein
VSGCPRRPRAIRSHLRQHGTTPSTPRRKADRLRFTLSERRGGDTLAQHRQRPGCRPPLPCWNCGLEFKHELFTFLTTSANKVVKPVHAKAMPVLLLTDADVETWLTAPTDEALELQKPAPDDAVIVLPEEKKAA